MIQTYSRSSLHKRLQYSTSQLWDNMVSPFCGILTCIYAYLRQTYDPKGIALGGKLTNVALVKGICSEITYHIGGMSMVRDDAMIKCLAEAYERYISFIIDPVSQAEGCIDFYENIKNKFPDDLLPTERQLQYFTEAQHNDKDFFVPFNLKTLMHWVKTQEIISKKSMWLPTHLLYLGYTANHQIEEKRINGAVSTGTAVHINYPSCILNSLLEMILIDATMGHWYANQKAYKIELDERTRHIEKVIQKSIPLKNIDIEFYYLPSADFSTFNVACVSRTNKVPKFSVGLGSDPTLEGAMYKAYLEFIGTRFLANSLAVLQEGNIAADQIQNLDDNVLWYAIGNNRQRIDERFNSKISVKARELPTDFLGNKSGIIQQILGEFRSTEKNIIFLDFTNAESRQLGFVATKLWSPDLLTLPLPKAVPINHLRFKVYGGVQHVDAHPYP